MYYISIILLYIIYSLYFTDSFLISRLQNFVTLHMNHDNILHSIIYLKVTRLLKLLLMGQFLIKSGLIHFYPPVPQT